jgi:hypothetical protein
MAGLKTPSKKKRDTSKPNTVLVIFLVFFILVSIGLGIWGYYGYAGQEKLEKDTKQANISTKAAKELADYALYMNFEKGIAIGGSGNPKDPVLPVDDAPKFDEVRKKVLVENGPYNAERTLEPFKKTLAALKDDLGPFDENSKKYPTNYRELLTKYKADLKNTEALLVSAQGDLKTANEKFAALNTKVETYWKNTVADVRKGNQESLKASSERQKSFETLLTLNQKLTQDLEDVKKLAGESEENYKRQIKKLNEAMVKLSADRADMVAGAGAANGGRQGDSMHALLLDISRGRPLWDNPLGKITRVDWQERQVYINLGSAHGIKPEVTFNIFGAAWNGRADKDLKGTIEVIRVLDANSSLARITSVYDADGREIVLGDPTRGRPQREADNAFKEGDLLFNLFWGSRVALAGNVAFAGQSSDNPAEQMRIMAGFVAFLARQGIAVDAYLDLNDGQIKGAISSRTRYLIRGDDLIDPARPAPKKKEAAKDKDGDGDEKKEDLKKDVEPMAEGGGDRIKMINDAASKMRLEAADKGLLIISAENFLNVIGYRQPRSAVYTEAAGFRPSAIFAGQPLQNPTVQAPPPKAEEKADDKAPEKKDMDKKDAGKKDDK